MMKQLSYQDSAIFCEQISMMIKSGIILHSGVQMIADDTSNVQKKAIYKHISDQLEKGGTLGAALKSSSAFPEYMIHIVEIGEKTGKLDAVLASLSAYYSRQQSMQEQIRSAIVYPLVLILMMLVVLEFLAARVLPVFGQVFNSLGTQMSPWAASVMRIGSLFSQYTIAFVIIFFILLTASLVILRNEKDRSALAGFLMGRKTAEKFAVATFASSMALMLSSGLDLDLAFKLSAQAVSNRSVKNKIDTAGTLMRKESVSFVEALGRVSLLSNTMTGLLSMGYLAGSADSTLEYIADLNEEEYQTSLMRKVSMIEPLSVVVISILIGSILISVMFPLLGVLSSIG